MIYIERQRLVQCCDLEQRGVVIPLHEGHTEHRAQWITRIGLTAEISRADNLSVPSRYQLDSAAGLRINGCDRGSNTHSCPLGQDTITIKHSHSSANASPPCCVPSITGSLSLCQHTWIWADHFANCSVNYHKNKNKKNRPDFSHFIFVSLSVYCDNLFSHCSLCAGACYSPTCCHVGQVRR